MNNTITYKYNIGDIVQIKTKFDSTASVGLKKLAGEVVTIIDCRYYGEPCYRFAELDPSHGWFTESCIRGKVNPFVIFAGDAQDDAEPIASAPNKATAIRIAKAVQGEYSYTEAIYMPEDDDDTNEVIYVHYEEVN